MKDLTTAPTAELLAEWGKNNRAAANHAHLDTDPELDVLKDMFAGIRAKKAAEQIAIAAELDSRTIGMNLMDGMPEISIDHVSILKQMTMPPKPVAVKVNIPIDELIERLKWLQIKGVNDVRVLRRI